MITERQSAILNATVQEYIDTAMPVSSGMVFDRGIFEVSCPTIRNEMADLTERGYLVQPHTSAGRVPTEKGYRFFVDLLIEGYESKPLRRNSESQSVGIKEELKDRARRISSSTSDLVVFVDSEDGEVKYLGLKKVFGNPEFNTHASVVSMLGELERFENYAGDAEKYLGGELKIFIGSENPFFENPEYSMISSRLNDSFIVLLGPMRMNYERNLSLLDSVV